MKPYHPDMTIGGETVSFAHLEPLVLNCFVRNLDRTLAIDVRFGNHCFSARFDARAHHPSLVIIDRGAWRAFDRERYAASKRLPDMVRALPGTSVWQTRQERNFVYFVVLTDNSGNDPMFPYP